MRAIFHSDWAGSNRGYGLGRYSAEISRALCTIEPSLELMPLAFRGGSHALRYGRVAIGCWAALGMPSIERWVRRADIVHSVELDYPVATRLPWVVTVHDLGPLTHPEYFSGSRPWLKRRAILQAIDKAAIIVAVSQATAESIESVAGRKLGARLRVVPEGVAQEFFEEADRSCLQGLTDLPPQDVPYFLWTGSLNPRKNIGNVIKAFAAVAESIPHHLVLAGGLGWDADRTLAELNSSAARDKIHRPGHVTDKQLRALYRGATAFIYVSLMEGFGLPILEAMASRCAVITSNVSSMPEVAGEAALLVDPTKPAAIAEAMLALVESPSLKQELIGKGVLRAQMFTWQRAAREMIALYRSATQR